MPARSPSYYSRGRSRSRSRGRSPYTPRSRSRTPSRSRGRSRSRSRSIDTRYTRYSDEERRYSDSFHSDEDDTRRSPARGKSIYSKYKPLSVKGTRQYGAKLGKKTGASTTTPKPSGFSDVVTKRMLSARRLKINELRNEIDSLIKELEEIRKENKTLRRDNLLQNKQLDKLQDKEGELPQMIDSHNQEVRALKEQIRRWKEKNDKAGKSLRSAENELTKAQRKIKRLQEIADDRKLEEREELSRRLDKAEADLDDRSRRVQQLERHVENLEKSHKREMITQMKKHATTKLELQNLQNEFEYTRSHLRDREKELEARNIYFNRINQLKHRGSVSSLPALEAPNKYLVPQDKTPEISPRQRAQQFDIKRREEQKQKKILEVKETPKVNKVKKTQPKKDPTPVTKNTTLESPESPKDPNPAPPKKLPSPPSPPKFDTEDSWERIMRTQKEISSQKKSVVKDSLDESNNRRSPTESVQQVEPSQSFFATEVPASAIPSPFSVRIEEETRRLEEARQAEKIRREEEERVQQQERIRQQEQDRVRQQKEEEERRRREEKERIAREERERYEHEELVRRKAERKAKETEEIRAREAAERARKEREEEEEAAAVQKEADERARLARERERERLENDAKAAEERRKKDILLQKMKDIDMGSTGVLSSKAPLGSSLFDSEPIKQQNGSSFFLTQDNSNSKTSKEYNFRETDENLYRGIPSKTGSSRTRGSSLFQQDADRKENPLFATNKKDSLFNDSDDLDFGGYQPSLFGASNDKSKGKSKSVLKPVLDDSNTWKAKDSPSNSKPRKDSNLDDLFGGSTFSSKTTGNKQSSIFDDDDFLSSPSKSKAISSNKQSFPWGDSPSTTPDKILPLRPRVDNSTIHNKPTVRAIDEFDDDLEELTL